MIVWQLKKFTIQGLLFGETVDKNVIAEFIVNKFIFNGKDSIEYNPDYKEKLLSDDLIKKIDELIISYDGSNDETVIKKAQESAFNKLKNDSNCKCYYEEKSLNTDGITIDDAIANTNKANSYKDKVGITGNITFYSLRGNSNFVGVEVNDNSCPKKQYGITESLFDGHKICDVSVYNSEYDRIVKGARSTAFDSVKYGATCKEYYSESEANTDKVKINSIVNESAANTYKTKAGITDDITFYSVEGNTNFIGIKIDSCTKTIKVKKMVEQTDENGK